MGIKIGLGAAAALLGAVMLCGWLATLPPEVRRVSADPAAADAAMNRFALVPPGEVSISFSETELTALAQVALNRSGDTSVTGLSLACDPGMIRASADYSWSGRSWMLVADLVPRAAGGRLQVGLQSLSVGRLPAPAGLATQVGDDLSGALDQAGLDRGLTVSGAQVQPGILVITGVKTRGS
ncbi:MAG: hypothetical protein ACYDAY_02485 [Candidatus Dormibacteria bacterium]